MDGLQQSLSDTQAALTLYHELYHHQDGPTRTQERYLEQEIQARIASEKLAIKLGAPETFPGYRTADGKVNEALIRKEINNSNHYNPQDKEHVPGGRRYTNEANVEGW